jgi:hypothetical protein
MYGAPFVGIMPFDQCIFSGGWSHSCPDGKNVACYNDNNSSDNNGDGGNNNDDSNSTGGGDMNNTGGDSNNTGNIDTTDIENKLDKIVNELGAEGTLNKALGNIGGVIKDNGKTIADKLDTLDDDLKSRLAGLNSNLGDKLDGIKGAIENKPTGTDLSETNNILRDIKDAMNPDIEADTSDLDTALSNAKNVFNDALLSFDTTRNDLISMFNGASAPTVSASGNCILSGSTRHIGTFTFNFSVLSDLRPAFQFFLNIFLLIFTIKLYTTIARDLVRYVTGV